MNRYGRGSRPPAPAKPGKARMYVPPMTLTLPETLVIRSRLAGKSLTAIAEERKESITWVNDRLAIARRRFGAATLAEFLAMPELLDAVREDT